MLANQVNALINMWERVESDTVAETYLSLIAQSIVEVNKMWYHNRFAFVRGGDNRVLTYLALPPEFFDNDDDDGLAEYHIESWNDHNYRNLIPSMMGINNPEAAIAAIDAMTKMANQRPVNLDKLIKCSVQNVVKMPPRGDMFDRVTRSIFGYVMSVVEQKRFEELLYLTMMEVIEHGEQETRSVINLILLEVFNDNGILRSEGFTLQVAKLVQATIHVLYTNTSLRVITGEDPVLFNKVEYATKHFGPNIYILHAIVDGLDNVDNLRAEMRAMLNTILVFTQDFLQIQRIDQARAAESDEA